MLSPLTYANVALEILSVIVCIVLLYGNQFETHKITEYGRVFSWLVLTNIIALISDCLSWALEYNPANTVILYICNTLSIVLAVILIAQFAVYIIEYLNERIVISRSLLRIILVFYSVVAGITLIACIGGFMFTIEDGVYYHKSFYYVYSVFAVVSLLAAFFVIIRYRKDLGVHDSVAAYIYIALPTISAFVNLWVEDLSFTYVSITISALVLYVMIQSEQNSKLLHEKQISSYYADHDDLTGLLSRRAYIERLNGLAGSEGTVGVIFCDLNGLKYTNDSFGHAEGDKLITNFSDMLSNHFGNEDIYRISGDEFIVIAEIDNESAFYENVRALENAINKEAAPIACIGAAYGLMCEAESLVQRAETIMYIRKEDFHRKHPEMHRLGL